MSGLLDFLGGEDGQLGIALLAAGGPSPVPMSFGQRLQQAYGTVGAQRDAALKSQLLKSQMDENASQAKLRDAQIAEMARKQALLGSFGSLLGGGAAPMGQGGATAGAAAPGNAMGAAPAAGGSGGVLANLSPDQIAQLKLAGIDMTDIYKLATVPTPVAAGSYSVLPGQAPKYMADPSKLTTIDPATGRVSLLPGALDALAAQTQVTEGIKGREGARFQEATPTFNQDGSKSVDTRLNRYGGQPAPALPGAPLGAAPAYRAALQNLPPAQPGMTSSFQGPPEQVLPLIAGMKDPQERANAYDAYSRQMTGGAPMIGPGAGTAPAANVVELSPAQQAANEAARVGAVDTAKADAARGSAAKTKAISSADMLNDVKRARELLKEGPTGSYLGSKYDAVLAAAGETTKGAELSARLNPVASKLVQNVPRMEGPQSDRDVEEYKNAAGRVNDSTLPPKLRLAALDEVERIAKRYAHLNGGTGGATGDFGAPPAAPSGLPSGWSVKVK